MAIEKSRADIINFALTLLGVKAADEEAQDSDVALAAEGLNDLVKVYQSSGAHLWARRDFTLFLSPAQIKYTIGPQDLTLSSGVTADPDTLDHSSETYTASTLVNAVTAGTSTIELDTNVSVTCDADSDILVGDYIALLTTSDGWWWSTVKSIDPPNVLLSTSIPEDLDAGTVANWYTEMLGKALRIPDARRQQGFPPTASEIEMVQLGRISYLNLPNKESSGTPVQFYYNPLIDVGEMFVWPAPTSNDQYLNGTYYRPISVFDNTASAADFPDEWVAALKYNLAVHMSSAYGGRPMPENLLMRATELYEMAKNWDQGDAPAYFEYAHGQGMS